VKNPCAAVVAVVVAQRYLEFVDVLEEVCRYENLPRTMDD
jgi:hypothetical protein